jgi:uncharacterized protein YcgI (DUF1989 family)
MKKVKESFHLPARTGKGFTVRKGDLIKIVDLQGQQPVDFWAFNKHDVYEYLSCEHTKPSIEKLFPRQGDAAYTTHRRPIMTLIEDHSPGQHDMQFAPAINGVTRNWVPRANMRVVLKTCTWL